MTKKIIYFLLLMFSFAMQAQNAVGDWVKHGIFGNGVQRVIDTDTKVFSLVDGWLYCYDKVNEETISLSETGDLNDVTISDISYNNDSKNLYIIYTNSNIDILNENGSVVNIPDIYNASINSSKKINDITFSNHGTFIATDFGYVRLNDQKNEVKESRIYNNKINSLCVVGDYLVLNTESKFYLEIIDKHYSSLSETISVSINQEGKIYPLSDNEFLFQTGWLTSLRIRNNDLEYGLLISDNGAKNLQQIKGGYQYTDNNGVFFKLNEQGQKISSISLPANMHNSLVSAYNDSTAMWELNNNGLRHVQIDENSNETVLMDYARPNASSVDIPFYMVYNEGLNKLYVMNCGSNRYYTDYLRKGSLSSYDGFTWKDEMPAVAPTINTKGQNNNRINAPYDLVFDPEDPTICYIGTWFEGVYKIKDGNVIAKYDWTNSPLEKVEVDVNFHTCTTPCIKFDKGGNLWILQSGGKNQFSVLPRSKQNIENISKEDWLTPQVNGVVGDFRSHLFITSRNVKLHGIGDYNDPLTIFYDDDNPASSNIQSKVFSSLTDQDGKEYTWFYINCFAEDKNGKVWMGTNNGVVEFYPQNALKSGTNFTINHLKVPRNDGTNLADYLLDNTDVTCIAVDGSNRKWIGTSTSGVLLVNEDGSEIIEQFTTENSPMLSNKVLSVCCNPINNKVYIGTEKGLMEYSSDSEPPAPQYEIYAYPNPVRPEYTGDITIRGLMENSLVKIADSAGNVVRSIRSTGWQLGMGVIIKENL